MEPEVSVLVPVYNMEAYLRQCLDSLVAQTLPDIEFICLNDGSTDSSLAILNEYASRDGRFVVVDKPNEGYGATMNEGLRRARGRYVGILESDDWVAPKCFATLAAAAREHGMCDIVKANHYKFSAEGERFVENYAPALCNRILSLSEDAEAARALILSIPAIWAAIYRRDFIGENGISFLESPGASYQDTGFVFKCWIAADAVTIIHDGFVHYRTGHVGSSSIAADKVFCVCDEFREIDAFLRNRPDRAPLSVLLAAKRFKTYRWNVGRVAWKYKKRFLMRTSAELRAVGQQGGWDKALFKKKEWRELRKWMADPAGLYLDMRIADAEKRRSATAHVLRVRRRVRDIAGRAWLKAWKRRSRGRWRRKGRR